MDGLISLSCAGTVANTSSFFTSQTSPYLLFSCTRGRRTTTTVSFITREKGNRFTVFASKDGDPPKLDQWDQMELKYGHLLGEDPKLTLAKIMGRKANPDASYLEIEKNFYKRKGKLVEIKEVPFDGSKEVQPSSSLDGLNLVRPVPKKGFTLKADDEPPKIKKPSQAVRKAAVKTKGSVPNVILRKPNLFNNDDGGEKPSKLRNKPNLSLKMGNGRAKDTFSDMTLLRKPEPVNVNKVTEKRQETYSNVNANVDTSESDIRKEEANDEFVAFTLLERPEPVNANTKLVNEHDYFGGAEVEVQDDIGESVLKDNFMEIEDGFFSNEAGQEIESNVGVQPLEQGDMRSSQEVTALTGLPDKNSVDSRAKLFMEAALQGKPKRLDQSVKRTPKSIRGETVLMNSEAYGNAAELDDLVAKSPLEGSEDTDWSKAQDLFKTGNRGEVELISSSTKGFVVSFGSLIGFLPYRNLTAKWKFLAFESWLRQKGLDPSMYRQNLGTIGSYDVPNRNTPLNSTVDPKVDRSLVGEISADMKLEDLLRVYDQEKIKFLSSFLGQKIKVNVVLADRTFRKLVFSVKPKEKEEDVDKKRSLMAKLQVGDVVKCGIKKITYFGIFVEVEGVPALIHQTEVSWDATLDPSSYFKIGQIVEAKVHQLDFALGRIFLSLKEISPDPLMEALESVVGDRNPLDGRLQVAQAEAEWVDIECLIKELQQMEGIQSVSKGRFFLSPGLAPTFQVYMASMFENQYKLLARSGNKVQEVIVQTSLGKEEMKAAILTCTNKV
ncbi:uncharacterized protein LOC122289677 isoform X3 [Carya illinoinensis]|uniref:uncharacterized protein LOC122289677 isoform X3 n=1 Tax=Carya illinoinensis TaxID=32201 RepID=UPI001C727EBD|nr:uncharacterized protein LOC122289677 isoform X3 [Carya illinoinensis]